FAEEQIEDSLRVQAGLQLQAQLVTQLYQAGGLERQVATAGKAETLQVGGIEIDGVGLAGGNHGAEPLARWCDGRGRANVVPGGAFGLQVLCSQSPRWSSER